MSVGSPDSDALAIAKASLDHALQTIRPEVTFGSLINEIEQIVTDAGYWHTFPQIHSLGPIALVGAIGISQDAYQPVRGADIVLQAGMVLSLENGAIDGRIPLNQVKLGGTGVVTPDGFEMWNTRGLSLQTVGT